MSAWYRSLSPLKVDVVGDFAGKELFAIHGDSMLLHCIAKGNVDYEDGFQLLHAVYAVETFLDNLRRRGCKFHIIWFDDHEDLCVPPSAKIPEPYLLTRAVTIKHFARYNAVSESGMLSFQFPSMDSVDYDQYLKNNAVYFFLFLDGHACFNTEDEHQALRYLGPVYRLGRRGYTTAFLDTLEFESSKVYVAVVPPSEEKWEACSVHRKNQMAPVGFKPLSSMDNREAVEDKYTSPWGDQEPPTVRDVVSLTALCNILLGDPSPDTKRAVAAYIIHLSILQGLELSKRPLGVTPLDKKKQTELDEFALPFYRICQAVLETEKALFTLEWDASDLIDGRILRRAFLKLEVLRIPQSAIARLQHHTNRIWTLTKVDVSDYLPKPYVEANATTESFHGAARGEGKHSVLPFNNPALESYLKDVHVDTTDSPELGTTDKVFEDITHWHNAKKPVDAKKNHQRPLDFRARRKNQKQMASTIAYSESLTNSSGKSTTRQIIVVTQPEHQGGKKARTMKLGQSAQNGQGNPQKAHRTKRVQNSGMTEAIKIENAKRDAKAKGSLAAWQSRCSEFEREEHLVKRFMKTTRYIIGLSAIDFDTVGAEVTLYAINTLSKILLGQHSLGNVVKSTASKFDVLALVWKMVIEMKSSSVSPNVGHELMAAAKGVGLPVHFTPNVSQETPLPFFSVLSKKIQEIRITIDPLEFQLRFCGPYLDRGFDPTPDPRVRFAPDAWQRKVLDTIDANKSLLVIAPTSSGKTFISFYAMKKVLQSSDDDVLVYVAPTKALVNQIAAEIQAEFSKSYKHQAKSVWAIHTRDYRVNNPTGCQILVTVPHILEIMLLAPSNSASRQSWARRVKRIIFDEVHCIGQAEDGVIWEHLLLLAPCPIIALSATVGNALEFKAWLEGAQNAKGFDLEMVVHASRYSDLRKFVYFPPDKYVFSGVEPATRLPVPGLDPVQANMDGKNTSRFAFIHPIASLTNRNRGSLKDISLEPRDCFELWQCMVKYQTGRYLVDKSLDPHEFLGAVAKKADVVKWEAALKEVLLVWMKDSDSPFAVLQQDLRSSIKSPLDSCGLDATNDSNTAGMCFETESLASTALPLLVDLSRQGALPALLFHYDRGYCERVAFDVLRRLKASEKRWKNFSSEWARKVRDHDAWEKQSLKRGKSSKSLVRAEEDSTKADMMRERASRDAHPMETFDPQAPVSMFSFADESKLLPSELEKHIQSLKWANLNPSLIECLRRGIGVHHSGMNRAYRQVIEMLFRKGYLTVVIATGTLALGINMPCKTVVFFGDSVFLTALNYHQGAGRSGRRGFDQLGNVVFVRLRKERVFGIMSSRLPDIQGHFSLSTTLVLRLLGLFHHTNKSEYAVNAINSMLSQTRLFLGGPSNQMAIKHHVRFSIEYLRRQNLLTREGVPLNFAGLVGHLYFTENAAFAFHSLLRGGYFYEVARDIHHRPKDVLLELTLVLAHLFCRIPMPRYKDQDFLETVVHRSTSMVLLPRLPQKAEETLRKHNQGTLDIFTTYVSTYVSQHLNGTPDNSLPFTGQRIKSREDPKYDFSTVLSGLGGTKLRSPFVALSGFTDTFDSIHELCDTVRSGVFLEESAVPYIPIYPDDTGGVPWNAYIYDFFKHGNLEALVDDNQIKRGDVWFHLKDFSLVLATITTSISNYFNQKSMDDASMMDVQGAGDDTDDESEGLDERDDQAFEKPAEKKAAVGHPSPKSKRKPAKAVVVDSWEDEVDDSSEEADSSSDSSGDEEDAGKPAGRIEDNDLMLVLTAFKKLREEFETKFKKIWA